MSYHSACAALFGICECRGCAGARGEDADETPERVPRPPTELIRWTIRARAFHLKALSAHWIRMHDMGFRVEPIALSRGWKEDFLPPGWCYFRASIPKSQLSDDARSFCIEWDRTYGEYVKEDLCDG